MLNEMQILKSDARERLIYKKTSVNKCKNNWMCSQKLENFETDFRPLIISDFNDQLLLRILCNPDYPTFQLPDKFSFESITLIAMIVSRSETEVV